MKSQSEPCEGADIAGLSMKDGEDGASVYRAALKSEQVERRHFSPGLDVGYCSRLAQVAPRVVRPPARRDRG